MGSLLDGNLKQYAVPVPGNERPYHMSIGDYLRRTMAKARVLDREKATELGRQIKELEKEICHSLLVEYVVFNKVRSDVRSSLMTINGFHEIFFSKEKQLEKLQQEKQSFAADFVCSYQSGFAATRELITSRDWTSDYYTKVIQHAQRNHRYLLSKVKEISNKLGWVTRKKRTLLEGNLPFVYRKTWHYFNKIKIRNTPFEDVFQEVFSNLWPAVDKYEPERGAFTTYLDWWIRQAMMKTVRGGDRLVYVPLGVLDDMQTYYKVKRHLTVAQQKTPTVEEIATAMNKTPEKIEKIQMAEGDIVSITKPIGDDTTIEDQLEDKNAQDFVDSIVNKCVLENVMQCLEQLEERERIVIEMHFLGSNGSGPYILDEIAAKFGVCRERIRQIEYKGMMKLRKMLRLRGHPVPTKTYRFQKHKNL